MNKRCFLGLTLMSGLCWAMAGHAAEKRRVQAEVDSLLASVEASAKVPTWGPPPPICC